MRLPSSSKVTFQGRRKPIPQALAVHGLRLALPAIGEAVRDGRSRPAREAMAHAAMLSGMCLANSGLGMAHGVAPALGCALPRGPRYGLCPDATRRPPCKPGDAAPRSCSTGPMPWGSRGRAILPKMPWTHSSLTLNRSATRWEFHAALATWGFTPTRSRHSWQVPAAAA